MVRYEYVFPCFVSVPIAQFERYCDEIENTSAWGGQLEVNNLLFVPPYSSQFHFLLSLFFSNVIILLQYFTFPLVLCYCHSLFLPLFVSLSLCLCPSVYLSLSLYLLFIFSQLRALSHVYQAPITVYQADAPPLCISEEEYPKERTLRVSWVLPWISFTQYIVFLQICPLLSFFNSHSFHQHEYSLGQHYNSVVSL